MTEQAIVLTQRDHVNLSELAQQGLYRKGIDRAAFDRLLRELERAERVPEHALPPGVVSMHTRAVVRDEESGERMEIEVVWPNEADVARNRINVLAPLGMAVLGCREGDVIDWPTPGGRRRFAVERVEGRAGSDG